MKEIIRAAGIVRIRVPDSASDVSDARPAQSTARATTRGGTSITDASGVELGIMLDALEDEDTLTGKPLAVVDRFAVDVGEGASSTTSRGRGAAGTDEQELEIDLNLQPGESAVVLVEQDGSYEWHYPTSRHESVGQRSPSRQRGAQGASGSNVSFRIPIGNNGPLPEPSDTARTHRGPITDFIKGKIQGVILKFIARKTVGALTRRLERGVTEGPVLVNSASDATQWIRQAAYPTENLPTQRPRRILLLVHGTFSSTVGSFGALTTHDEGKALLQQALSQYDLVIGHDHYTLSETPEQNAEGLLAALIPLIGEDKPLEIDAIAFSRGGLVYRYLSEVLIPDSSVSIICRKAIFVGCTNNGTELANDENWKQLMDFYTNMIAGATRLLGLAPGAALPTQILRQGIKVIGSMVTYIAQDSVANNSVPGVAAMEPDGAFVTAMNAQPAHRINPGALAYYALGSNFEPSANSDEVQLGKRLVFKVADGVVDELMGRANDLVVNNDSMFVIDPVPGSRLVEKRSVNANGRIYHTVYFHQPMVADACGQWLGILEPVRTTRGIDSRSNQPQSRNSSEQEPSAAG